MIVEQNREQTTQPKRVETLATKLTGPELNGVIQDALKRQTEQLSPADVLVAYQANPLVKPASIDVMGLRTLEDQFLAVMNAFGYTPIELSPVAPLGSRSVITAADPNQIVSAVGSMEVVSDAATALSLHVADQRTDPANHPAAPSRLSTLHRPIQSSAAPDTPGTGPHTKMACFIAAGRSSGNYQFEKETFTEHVTMMALYLRDILLLDDLTFRLYSHKGYRHPGAFSTLR